MAVRALGSCVAVAFRGINRCETPFPKVSANPGTSEAILGEVDSWIKHLQLRQHVASGNLTMALRRSSFFLGWEVWGRAFGLRPVEDDACAV